MTAKFANPQMTTEMAEPWARDVEGKISVGISQTCESQPMPKMPVAMKRTILPMMVRGSLGILRLSAFWTRPPSKVKTKKQAKRPKAPPTIMMRRPMRSMRSHAKVIRKK